jgi:SAM-dependent methyltransferase
MSETAYAGPTGCLSYNGRPPRHKAVVRKVLAMGEIFSRPLPGKRLPFTGERLTSELGGQTEIEHLHRYLLARNLCRGKEVLDIASGEGYGSALLSQVATSVVGVDVSAEACEHAAANYQSDRLQFLQGNAHALPLVDNSVEIVVSFETIEHFNGHDRFLSEVKRVLRPGGTLILSTPDRDNYSPAEQSANPFHVLEMTRDELGVLLKRHFTHVSLCWQRAVHGSVLIPGTDVPIASEVLTFERRGAGHFEASTGYPRPQYLLAVCSDKVLQPIPVTVYIDTSHLNAREDSLRQVLAAEQERIRVTEGNAHKATLRMEAAETACREAERRAANATQSMEAAETVSREAQGQAAAVRLALDQERASTLRLRDELSERELALVAMKASTSWRLTAPLRAARRFVGRQT